MSAAATNTIATIGDIHYLWGIFLLVASARKAGMEEPFLVGTRDFTPRAERVLEQLGGVRQVRLDGTRRSPACLKPRVLLEAGTEYATWADSDAFFSGNVSGLLVPDSPEEIQFRLRTAAEMPAAFRGHEFGEDGTRIPRAVLEVWRRDVESVAGAAAGAARYATSGSTAFFSLSPVRHRRFLEIWAALQEKVLPERDVGVVDGSLSHYHQLDESTLNACLNFVPDAPRVQETFRVDKEGGRMYVHFNLQPKPWQGWTRGAFRHFDGYVAVVDWAAARGYELPGPVPVWLQASRKRLCRALIPWTTLRPKVAKRLGRVFRRGGGA